MRKWGDVVVKNKRLDQYYEQIGPRKKIKYGFLLQERNVWISITSVSIEERKQCRKSRRKEKNFGAILWLRRLKKEVIWNTREKANGLDQYTSNIAGS